MFTGIIEATVKVVTLSGAGKEFLLTVQNPFSVNELKIGDSIAVDGVCLTITAFDPQILSFFISEATVKKSKAATYTSGTAVNLERAMIMNGRLDGHIVTGHVDTLSAISAVRKIGKGIELYITIPLEFLTLVVNRGSIAVNGISLTIAEIKNREIMISLIPETLSRTSFAKGFNVHEKVNLEFDILGKYVQRQLGNHNADYEHLLKKL